MKQQGGRSQAKSRGQNPVEHVVGYDALAVFLHPDNPLDSVIGIRPACRGLRRRGRDRELGTQLDVEVPGCKGQEIILVSRQNNSGHLCVLPPGRARRQARLQARHARHARIEGRGSPGREDAVRHRLQRARLRHGPREDAVRQDRGRRETASSPSVATASDGSYPVARPLLMYTNGDPQGAIKSYLDWILSDEGQCIILDKGYAPVRAVRCE